MFNSINTISHKLQNSDAITKNQLIKYMYHNHRHQFNDLAKC